MADVEHDVRPPERRQARARCSIWTVTPTARRSRSWSNPPMSCMESFQPGELDPKELGYKDLAAVNPGIVMASITAFGQTGPKKNLALQRSRRLGGERNSVCLRRSVDGAVQAAGDAGLLLRERVRHRRRAGSALPAREAPVKAITSTPRCRKPWRPRSTSFGCGPMRSRFPNAPAASMARWLRRKYFRAETASSIST